MVSDPQAELPVEFKMEVGRVFMEFHIFLTV